MNDNNENDTPFEMNLSLKESTYTSVSHALTKRFGLTAAFWISEMVTWEMHIKTREENWDDDFWFFYEQSHFERKTGMLPITQSTISKKMEAFGIIDRKRKGAPPRTWYKINHEVIQTYKFLSFKSKDFIGLNLKNLKLSIYKIIKERERNPRPKNLYKNGLRPCFYRFSEVIQTIQMKAFPSKFKKWNKEQLKAQVNRGAEAIGRLVTLDKYEFETQIKPAILWAVKNEFWMHQIEGVEPLRIKSKKNSKFSTIHSQWCKDKKIDPKRGRTPKWSDFEIITSSGQVLKTKKEYDEWQRNI